MGDVASMLGVGSAGGSLASSAIEAKQSRDQMRLQRQALDEQRNAQAVASSASAAQQRRNEEAQARATRRAPNIAALLLGEQEIGATPSTSLSGPRGAGKLNKTTLLGD